MLTSSDSVYFESARSLSRQLRAARIEVLQPAPFDGGVMPGEALDKTLDDIKRSGIRCDMPIAFKAEQKTVALLAGSSCSWRTMMPPGLLHRRQVQRQWWAPDGGG